MSIIPVEDPRHMGIVIRSALSRDIPRIMEIERLAFGGQWDYFQFKASMDDIFLVAADSTSGDLVGFLVACCRERARWGIILRIAVHPDYQGQGLATQLLEKSFWELEKQDMDEVELDVDILKTGALRLYEKLGFKLMATLSPDFEEDSTFFIMRRKLGPSGRAMAV
jgi:[ribosomal protein S18]-alanine N-acetyltransferase